MIGDFVRHKRYHFVIILKNKTVISINPELYLNSYRVNQIEKVLIEEPIQIQRNVAAKIYLKLADFTIIIFILVFTSILVTLYQKTIIIWPKYF